MKFLAYFFVLVLLSVVSYVVFELIHVAFVHIKAYIIRRKLSKLADMEKKKDD
jgi:hypothetical protein